MPPARAWGPEKKIRTLERKFRQRHSPCQKPLPGRGAILSFHGTDDDLESYVLGRLSEPELARLEEHLIVCAGCRDRLSAAEAFAAAMKAAPQSETRMPPERKAWASLLRRPVVSMTLAFVALIAIVSFFSTGRTKFAAVSTLTLTAERGAMPATAPAQELDLTLANAPAGSQVFRVEIVSAAGQIVWSGLAPATAAGVQVKANQHLPPGDYFVRLYALSGGVLREYGFRIRQ